MVEEHNASPKIVENVPVRTFFENGREHLRLELVAGEAGLDRAIREKSINRPALTLTGYFRYFANKRMQLFGAGEMDYMRHLPEDRQIYIMEEVAKRKIPCIVISRGFIPLKSMVTIANKANIPIFRSRLKSKDFSSEATILLEELFAPHTTLYGTLLDIRGIGTLIRGQSGVGKSECALALIERGHSLVADDVCHVHLMNDRELVGTSSKLNRGYMECRGLGIINITELFGIRSVRTEKRIDLVVTFLAWELGIEEERTGLDQHYFSVLGQNIAHIEIPVRPGRDLARLVEVASMVHALKQVGHNSAEEFNQRLIAHMMEASQ